MAETVPLRPVSRPRRATVNQALVAMEVAALAAVQRTDEDLARVDAALADMEGDIKASERGVNGDESFQDSQAAAAAMCAHVDKVSDVALLRD
ncbi:MAG: hypothetical protein ACJ72A_11945 [Nocardioidaceae bacterium]